MSDYLPTGRVRLITLVLVCVATPALLYGVDNLCHEVWIGSRSFVIKFNGETEDQVSRVRYGWVQDAVDPAREGQPLEDYSFDVGDAVRTSTGWLVWRNITGRNTWLFGREINRFAFERVVLEAYGTDGSVTRATRDVPLATAELAVELNP